MQRATMCTTLEGSDKRELQEQFRTHQVVRLRAWPDRSATPFLAEKPGAGARSCADGGQCHWPGRAAHLGPATAGAEHCSTPGWWHQRGWSTLYSVSSPVIHAFSVARRL